MTDQIIVPRADLEQFAAAIFSAAGVAPDLVRPWAEVLVWANLRGTDSHGVIRIPRYVELLKKKAINPAPGMRIERRTGAIAVLDADRGPGGPAMIRAMDEAIARAREVHVGWCAAKNITHAGAIGYFALRAAAAGMAGIVMTASGPLMAYHGACVSGVSTNPLAIAVPAGKRRPFLLDMSTSTVAFGKVLAARDKGVPVPSGWGLDSTGRDTTDPNAIATLVPLGGAKGSGLSTLIECLASLTVANPLISVALTAGGGFPENPVLNGAAIAVDLAAFGDLATFEAEVDRLGDALSALLSQREAAGIPVPAGTWTRLVATAKELGVTSPA
jgi:ureidoglycolate dehydrogenase (NAD+)